MKRILNVSMYFVISGIMISACNNNDKNTKRPAVQSESKSTSSKLSPKTADGETFTCTMHHEVMSSKQGTCSKCGMKLVKEPITQAQQQLIMDGKFLSSKEEQ